MQIYRVRRLIDEQPGQSENSAADHSPAKNKLASDWTDAARGDPAGGDFLLWGDHFSRKNPVVRVFSALYRCGADIRRRIGVGFGCADPGRSMSDAIDPGIPTPGISQSKTNWRPIGLTILSSFLLAATSCFGAIEFHGKVVMSIFAVIFFASALVLVCGCLWAIGVFIEKLTRGD
jgi:hypothetical protein